MSLKGVKLIPLPIQLILETSHCKSVIKSINTKKNGV
jgi:hypothetical protein